MTLSLLFGFLVATLVLMIFFGVWRLLGPAEEMEARLSDYETDYDIFYIAGITDLREHKTRDPYALPIIKSMFVKGAFGKTIAHLLSQANWSINPSEYILIMIIGAMIGAGIGILRGSLLYTVLLVPTFFFLPYFYLKNSANKRRQAIAGQTAELLKFLTGALRAGFGLSQALESIADQLPSPMSDEIQQVLQTVRLGLSLPEALTLMAQRVQSDELDMLVVAINVQYETGGNLAPTLDSIGKTIQDRLQIKREIRALTAQQRMSGYILALLPIGLAIFMYIANPNYIMRLFAPGWVRILPASALLMMLMGFLVIRKIIEIEV